MIETMTPRALDESAGCRGGMLLDRTWAADLHVEIVAI
jgi:hypothetical protein